MGERKGLPWGRNDTSYDPLGLPRVRGERVFTWPEQQARFFADTQRIRTAKDEDLTAAELYYKELNLKPKRSLALERYEAGDRTLWSRLSPQDRAHYWREYHAALAVRHQRDGKEDLAEHHRAQAEKYRSMFKGE